MSRRLTDLQLERFLAEALSAAERLHVESVLSQSETDAEALRLLQADTAALFLQVPPAAFTSKVLPPPKKASLFGTWLAAFTALAALIVAMVVLKGSPDDEMGVKGSVGWKVTASGPTGQRALHPRAAVFSGETLSFRVTSAQRTFVAVISHAPDGWFVYAPMVQIDAGQSVLPQAAKLDTTQGAETLFLVASDAPFDPEAVKAQLRDAQVTSNRLTMETLPLEKRAE